MDKESPVIAHIKMQKEIEKGPTGLKKTETHVKEVMPTAEGEYGPRACLFCLYC